MNSVLITGCNRGIGFGLVKYLSENRDLKFIFATCRNPDQAQELQEISNKHSNVKILKADTTNDTDIKNLASEVKSHIGSDGLNVLINNAGVSSKYCRLGMVKRSDLEENLKVNTIAPILVSKAIAPLIKKSDSLAGGIIINVSSIMASIQQNTTGGFYPYRTSKAALNAATKSMSCDLKDNNIIVVSLHPGWLKTSMGGPQAPLSVDEAVPDIIKFIETLTPDKSGSFYSYDGKELPW
ncbi:C-signal [Planococcus citri]|uniref:C-signal n=1 Tax=Planococcus citri TaxID=170843 RepID=UPI0031F7692B